MITTTVRDVIKTHKDLVEKAIGEYDTICSEVFSDEDREYLNDLRDDLEETKFLLNSIKEQLERNLK